MNQNNSSLIPWAIGKAFTSLLQPRYILRFLGPLFFCMMVALFCLFYFWTPVTTSIELFFSDSGVVEYLRSLFPNARFRGGEEILFQGISIVLFLTLVFLGFALTLLLIHSFFLVPLIAPLIAKDIDLPVTHLQTATFFFTLKNTLIGLTKAVILAVILFPIIFFPLGTFLWGLTLNAYLTQKLFPLDILQSFAPADEIIQIRRDHKKSFWSLALILGLFFSVPVVGLITPALLTLAFGFYTLETLKRIRQSQGGTPS